MSWKDDKNLGSWDFTPRSGWKDDKGLGSWAFTKQADKPSYNEGDHIATYASPVWSMEEGSNVPITPTHEPCGYWTSGPDGYVPPTSPWFPPSCPNKDLVAWYKLNEGGGTDIINSANPTIEPTQKWPDLEVTLNPIYFWDQKPGFGSSGIGANGTKAIWTGDPSSYTTHGGSCSCFVYVNGLATNSYPHLYNCQSTIGDALDGRILEQKMAGLTGAIINFGGFRNLTTFGQSTNPQFSYPTDKLRWIFNFVYYDPADGKAHIGLVRDNGTLTVAATVGGPFDYTQTTIKQIRLFRYYDSANVKLGYFNGSLGDIMVWRNCGMLLSGFAEIYDNLRSRYGMAIRSGW